MLSTERLNLRRFRLDDTAEFRRLMLDKMASIYAPYDHQFPTDEKTISGIAAYFASSDAFWIAEDRKTGEMIGSFSLNPCEEPDARNLGYTVFSSKQGQGYATEACQRLIDYAFNELNLGKIVSGTALCNRPSVRLLEKLGFKKVSELQGSFVKDNDGNPITFTGGAFELLP